VGTLVEIADRRQEDRVRGVITDVSPNGSIQFSGGSATPADNLDFVFNREGSPPLQAVTKDGEVGQVLRVLWLPENRHYPEMHRVLLKVENRPGPFSVYCLDELSVYPF